MKRHVYGHNAKNIPIAETLNNLPACNSNLSQLDDRPSYLRIIPQLRSHTSFFATDSPDDIVCNTHAQHKRPCKHCTEGYTILEEVKQ
jgi:hypothetical protein